MATDSNAQSPEDEMQADEREVLQQRGEQLDEVNDDALLTADEVAENLGLDAE
jgi:hypothetical protein